MYLDRGNMYVLDGVDALSGLRIGRRCDLFLVRALQRWRPGRPKVYYLLRMCADAAAVIIPKSANTIAARRNL